MGEVDCRRPRGVECRKCRHASAVDAGQSIPGFPLVHCGIWGTKSVADDWCAEYENRRGRRRKVRVADMDLIGGAP